MYSLPCIVHEPGELEADQIVRNTFRSKHRVPEKQSCKIWQRKSTRRPYVFVVPFEVARYIVRRQEQRTYRIGSLRRSDVPFGESLHLRIGGFEKFPMRRKIPGKRSTKWLAAGLLQP